MGFGDIFRGVKDAGSTMAVERWLARELEPYGELLNLELNSRNKTLRLNVHLKGENHNVEIGIQDYELLTEGGRDYIRVKQATASREWLRALAQNFLIGRKIEIPSQYASLARMVL